MMKLTTQVKWTLGLALSLLLIVPARIVASNSSTPAKNSPFSGWSSWLTVGTAAGIATAGFAALWTKKKWNDKHLPQDSLELVTKYGKTISDIGKDICAKITNNANQDIPYIPFQCDRHKNASGDLCYVQRSQTLLFFTDIIWGNEEEFNNLHDKKNRSEPCDVASVITLNRYLESLKLREKNPNLETMPKLKHFYQAQNRIRQAEGKSFTSDPFGTIKRFFARY